MVRVVVLIWGRRPRVVMRLAGGMRPLVKYWVGVRGGGRWEKQRKIL